MASCARRRRWPARRPGVSRISTAPTRLLRRTSWKHARTRSRRSPGLELVRVAKPGQRPPGLDEGVLDRVLGGVLVAQDHPRDRGEPADRARDELGEGVSIASRARTRARALLTTAVCPRATCRAANDVPRAAPKGSTSRCHGRSFGRRVPSVHGGSLRRLGAGVLAGLLERDLGGRPRDEPARAGPRRQGHPRTLRGGAGRPERRADRRELVRASTRLGRCGARPGSTTRAATTTSSASGPRAGSRSRGRRPSSA